MRRLIPVAVALAAPAVAPAFAAAQTRASEASIVAEARAFMTHYAEDLRMGDRSAIAARYARGGAWRVGPAEVEFQTQDQVRTSYLRRWAPPSSFDWQDLAFDPIGEDAVAVTGRFLWGPGPNASKPPMLFTYTGLLVREDGQLRIRLEHESAAAPTPRRKR
jgi:hypothetical protein